MKKICLLFLLIMSLFLTSCMEDTTQEAKEEFSKYFSGNNEVVLLYSHKLYTETSTFGMDLAKGENFNQGVLFDQGTVWFSTSKINGLYNYTLNIYKANLDGSDMELVFTKDGYKTSTLAYATNGVFYINHHTKSKFFPSSELIDKYSLADGTYENIAAGEDCDLSKYRVKETRRYTVEVEKNKTIQEHGKFTVTDTETGISKVIDDAFLDNTEYIESMKIFNYSPFRSDISNGHILLTYEIGAGDGWNYPHLVFEYDFEENTLEYKMLVFAEDSDISEIIYIGS